jgi:hypothetical protein
MLILILFSVSCTNQNKPLNTSNNDIIEITPQIEQESKEAIMHSYISKFLTEGYCKHYVINSIESKILEQNAENNKIEAIINTKMTACNPLKNPDTVPYIKAVKEKAFKETNADKKHMLQQEYMTLYSEYLKPFDNNFSFKLIAELLDDKIKESSIELLIQTEGNEVVKYVPAEEILPQ